MLGHEYEIYGCRTLFALKTIYTFKRMLLLNLFTLSGLQNRACPTRFVDPYSAVFFIAFHDEHSKPAMISAHNRVYLSVYLMRDSAY